MQPEAEPWEALDLDESDRPSLRPCKRNKPSNRDNPSLERCSLRCSQASSPLLPRTAASPRLIPGPAGAIQAAMHRKLRNFASSFGADGEPIPTQEYIRRAVEDLGEDDEFSYNPWLFAVDFVRNEGMVGDDGIAIGTPLSVINSGFNMDKVHQVVAIVKSCPPNGLGDLMVTLKDPTGTIDASIHHRVLIDSEYGRDICIGAVLILQQVAVFAPSRSARYLNITHKNMVKVISKDSGPPLKQNYPALTVKHYAPVVENCKHAQVQQNPLFLSQGRTERIINSLKQNAKLKERMHFVKEIEAVNSVCGSSCQSNGSRGNQNPVVGEQTPLVNQDAANGMKDITIINSGVTDDDYDILVAKQASPLKETGRSSELGGVQSSNASMNLVEVCTQDNVNGNGLKRQSQPVLPRSTLPHWTDEQLDVLLAFD